MMKSPMIILMSIINFMLPKKKNKIVLYGRQSFNENTQALLDYFIRSGLDKSYKIYSIVAHPDLVLNPGQTYVETGMIKGLLHLLTAKYIFHTFLIRFAFKPSHGQIVMNLWHGSPLKTVGSQTINSPAAHKQHPETDTYFLNASDYFYSINQKCFLHNNQQIKTMGFPRNDDLFCKKNVFSKLGIDKKKYCNIVLFMPTYRTSDYLKRKDSVIEIPVLNQDNISKLDTWLKEKNICLIIKPHPAQSNIPLFQRTLENIKLLKSMELRSQGVRLYQLLGEVDALLTDYSSVYFDFLLTQKPIGFTIEDIDAYKANRGFAVEDDPLTLMPGHKIYCYDDLLRFLEDVHTGHDEYATERKRVNDLANKYQDNLNCERLLKFLKII